MPQPRYSPITLGQTLRRAEVGDFVLTEDAHPATTSLPPHAHEFASLSFVLEGSFTEVLGGRPQRCDPWSLLVKPAGELHSDEYGGRGARCLLVEVKPRRLESVRAISRLLDRAAHLRSRSLATLAQQVYRELHLRDGASALAIEGLLLELLGQAAREGDSAAGGEQPAWLRRATEFIHEKAAERLSLSSVAEAAGVHPAHLAKIFRRHYHCTVGEYVRRLRLERAARELASSAKSLVEIAVDAGFYDQSHFTNAFRLHTGTTPARYRRASGADSARPTPPRFPKTS